MKKRKKIRKYVSRYIKNAIATALIISWSVDVICPLNIEKYTKIHDLLLKDNAYKNMDEVIDDVIEY